MTGHDFAWAVNELKAGRAVKRRGVVGDRGTDTSRPLYTVFIDRGGLYLKWKGEEGWPWCVTVAEITAENWQPAEEGKPKPKSKRVSGGSCLTPREMVETMAEAVRSLDMRPSAEQRAQFSRNTR